MRLRTSRFISLLRSSSGQAELIGLIVASGIGALIIAANTQMIVGMTKQTANISQTAESLDVVRELETMLADPETCKRNFEGLTDFESSTSWREVNLVSASGVEKIKMNEQMYNNSVMVTKWRLNRSIVIRVGPPARNVTSLMIYLKKRDGTEGAKEIVRTVKLLVNKTGDVDSGIESCYTLIGGGSDIWLRDVTGNNIFTSNSGNVGIGIQSATSRLQVVGGNMRVSGSVTGNDFNAITDYTTSGSTAVSGKVSFGSLGTPTQAMEVLGNSLMTGDLTVAGVMSYAGLQLTTPGNMNVGGSLSVGGNSQINSLTTSSNVAFNSTSTFAGSATFNSPVTMAQTLAVNGAVVSGATSLGVNGSMLVNGSVTVPRVNANTAFCIGTDCRTTFSAQVCPSGYSAWRINDSGIIDCVNTSCPSGFYFQGVNAGGGAMCLAMPTRTCASNSYIDNYDAVTGVFTCKPIPPEVQVSNCPAGQFLMGINGGVPQCQAIQFAASNQCPVGQVVMDINSDATVVCRSEFELGSDCGAGRMMTGLLSNGTPVCADVATANSCSPGQYAIMNANGTVSCQTVAVVGGGCPTGVQSIDNTGRPTCKP